MIGKDLVDCACRSSNVAPFSDNLSGLKRRRLFAARYLCRLQGLALLPVRMVHLISEQG